MLQKATVAQPFFETRNPGSDWFMIAASQAETMSAAAVNVKFRRHASSLKPEIHFG